MWLQCRNTWTIQCWRDTVRQRKSNRRDCSHVQLRSVGYETLLYPWRNSNNPLSILKVIESRHSLSARKKNVVQMNGPPNGCVPVGSDQNLRVQSQIHSSGRLVPQILSSAPSLLLNTLTVVVLRHTIQPPSARCTDSRAFIYGEADNLAHRGSSTAWILGCRWRSPWSCFIFCWNGTWKCACCLSVHVTSLRYFQRRTLVEG